MISNVILLRAQLRVVAQDVFECDRDLLEGARRVVVRDPETGLERTFTSRLDQRSWATATGAVLRPRGGGSSRERNDDSTAPIVVRRAAR